MDTRASNISSHNAVLSVTQVSSIISLLSVPEKNWRVGVGGRHGELRHHAAYYTLKCHLLTEYIYRTGRCIFITHFCLSFLCSFLFVMIICKTSKRTINFIERIERDSYTIHIVYSQVVTFVSATS